MHVGTDSMPTSSNAFIQSREPFRRHRLAVDARGAGTGVKPLPYPHQLAYQRLI